MRIDKATAELPERSTASAHRRFTSSVGHQCSGSSSSPTDKPGVTERAARSNPCAQRVLATPCNQADGRGPRVCKRSWPFDACALVFPGHCEHPVELFSFRAGKKLPFARASGRIRGPRAYRTRCHELSLNRSNTSHSKSIDTFCRRVTCHSSRQTTARRFSTGSGQRSAPRVQPWLAVVGR